VVNKPSENLMRPLWQMDSHIWHCGNTCNIFNVFCASTRWLEHISSVSCWSTSF